MKNKKEVRKYPELYIRGTGQLCILYPNDRVEVYFNKHIYEDEDGEIGSIPGGWAKSYSTTPQQLTDSKAWLRPKFITEIK